MRDVDFTTVICFTKEWQSGRAYDIPIGNTNVCATFGAKDDFIKCSKHMARLLLTERGDHGRWWGEYQGGGVFDWRQGRVKGAPGVSLK